MHIPLLDLRRALQPLSPTILGAWRAAYRRALSLPQAERAAQEILSLPVFP